MAQYNRSVASKKKSAKRAKQTPKRPGKARARAKSASAAEPADPIAAALARRRLALTAR